MTNKQRCESRVMRSFHFYQCERNATTEHEGKHYCKTHNPALVKAKRDAKEAQWERNWEERKAKLSHDAAITALGKFVVAQLNEGIGDASLCMEAIANKSIELGLSVKLGMK